MDDTLMYTNNYDKQNYDIYRLYYWWKSFDKLLVWTNPPIFDNLYSTVSKPKNETTSLQRDILAD